MHKQQKKHGVMILYALSSKRPFLFEFVLINFEKLFNLVTIMKIR